MILIVLKANQLDAPTLADIHVIRKIAQLLELIH